MRYFWHFLLLAILATTFIVLFFALSLSTKDKITFTDQNSLTEPIVTIVDPALGPKTAPVTLVNFGDYECAGCANLENNLSAIRAEYGNQVRIVWKDMPNSSQHPEAISAAVAAHCAGEQDAFWSYHNLLMQNSANLEPALYLQIADELELKSKPFARCLEDESTLPLVQRGFDEGLALGITATPTIFINGERYTGAMTTSEISRVIDTLISAM